MLKSQILVIILLLINIYEAFAQSDIFTGSLNAESVLNLIDHVEADDDFYYFGVRNADSVPNSISIFKTTTDFEEVKSIENLIIRDSVASLLSMLKIVNDRLLLVSNGVVDSKSYLFTHSLDLNLENHTIIDSIEIDAPMRFRARDFKYLDDKVLYTFGNLVINNTSNVLSTNYLEIDINGIIREFEEVRGTSSFVFTFDDNQNTNQFLIAGPFGTFTLDTSFIVTSLFNDLVPIPEGSYSFFNPWMSSCEYVSDSTVECISTRGEDEYTTFVSVLDIEDGELQFSHGIPLHPDSLQTLRFGLNITSRDTEENYYFAYHEPSISKYGSVNPNKVFISKFDKNFNNIFFLELLDENEHTFANSIVDKDNNLIVVGSITSPDNPTGFKNSFIKISDTGELLTSTNSIFRPDEIVIYPNPSINYIKVQFDENSDVEYLIYSIDGRLEKRGKASSAGGIFDIETHDLPSGMHILNVFNGGRIYVTRFVKE